ncbi:MAG: hypothetical protein WD156_08775 [Acidimicrobiia bacterium]
MSSLEDRLHSAGRETRSVFDRMPLQAADTPSPRTRALAFAGGVVVVALLIAVPAVLSGGEPVPFGSPGSPENPPIGATTSEPATSVDDTSATTIAPAPVFICGGDLPVSVELPDDFDGPTTGASPQAAEPLEDGQLGVHWTGRDGSVEIRWPTDLGYRGADVGPMGTPGNVSFVLFGTDGPGVFADNPHGFPDSEQDSLESDWVANDCHVAQLTVYGPAGSTDASVDTVFGPASEPSVLRLAPTLPRLGENQLVIETRTVEVPPEVVVCQAPSEEPTISETIADPVVHPTPTEALQAYVETVDRWPNLGYFEFVEPDGTITYGKAFEPDPMTVPTPDDGLVIAVSVVPMGDGWAVDGWESSGC